MPEPSAGSSVPLLGARVDAVTRAEAIATVARSLVERRFLQIVTVNAVMCLESEKDPELHAVFQSAGLCVADSIGVALAARLSGLRLPERIPGIDFLADLCAEAERRAWSVFLLGAEPGVAEQTQARLAARFPRLRFSGTFHGYFRGKPQEERRALSLVREARPDLVFVALATPFQEKWIRSHAGDFGGACAMGVGGSFDVLSGRLRRAPVWMQRAGLEWLFRLIQQPWRWKRILPLPTLIFKILTHRS